MKKTMAVSIFLTLAALSAAAQSNTLKSFDLMKTLAGNWEGKSNMGEVKVSYRLTAGGSALMSEIQGDIAGKSDDMISMIHLERRPAASTCREKLNAAPRELHSVSARNHGAEYVLSRNAAE